VNRGSLNLQETWQRLLDALLATPESERQVQVLQGFMRESRERNAALRRKKISSVVAAGGPLTCEVCEFDFSEFYGERGRGFIECHHVEPLHVGGQKVRTIRDLALLCSNCHRMIHTRPPWPTPAELREIVRREAGKGS